MAELETIFFDGPHAFEAWLEAHAEASDGVLVKMAKKHTGTISLDWTRGVEVALCFGWIDGQAKRVDEDWFLQKFTPRRPRSIWSKVNRQKVETLEAAGRMRAGGRTEVERAKADGRWEAAYDGVAAASVPSDLESALEKAGQTKAFGELDSRNRYAILHRVQTAKKPRPALAGSPSTSTCSRPARSPTPRSVAAAKASARLLWAVETLEVRPDDRELEVIRGLLTDGGALYVRDQPLAVGRAREVADALVAKLLENGFATSSVLIEEVGAGTSVCVVARPA